MQAKLPPDPAACPGATGGHFCRFTRAQLPSALPLAWPRALARMIIARSHAQCARASAASHPAPSRARSGPTSAYRCCGPRWRRNYTAPGSRSPAPAPCFRLQPCVDPPSPLVFDPECPSQPYHTEATQRLSRHPLSRYLLAQKLSRGAAHSTATIDLTEECHSLLQMMP